MIERAFETDLSVGDRPLDDAWQGVLDAVLRSRGAPALADVARLGPKVVEVSRVYNAGLAGDGTRAPLEGRIAFSFARDVPKGAAAVRELVAAGALVPPADRPLRIVDLGAGLGAMTWGIARAAGAAEVHATFVDDDPAVLGAAEAIAREAEKQLGARAPKLTVTSRVAKVGPRVIEAAKLEEADVVVLGQVLSELDRTLEPEARVARHAELVRMLLDRIVRPDGSVVIVEPALRERSRHLHAVRDALVQAGTTVFAPCLHAEACPALAVPGEWCHDDRDVNLPAWLVPLARAASLRWEGLTFTHLVLRRDGERLREASLLGEPGAPKVHLRVISDRIVSKGKIEVFGCTASGERLRIRRLDRDAPKRGPDVWSSLRRGDVVTLSSTAPMDESGGGTALPIDDRGRVDAAAAVDVWPPRK